MKTIILGYGNTLRKDDGLGVYAAEDLALICPPEEVEIMICQQLSPEVSARLAQVDQAIFIDAALAAEGEGAGQINMRSLQPQASQPGSLSHHFDPEMLLAMAEGLYGHTPGAVLFSVAAADFGLGEGLSPQVAKALPLLVGQVKEYLNTL